MLTNRVNALFAAQSATAGNCAEPLNRVEFNFGTVGEFDNYDVFAIARGLGSREFFDAIA